MEAMILKIKLDKAESEKKYLEAKILDFYNKIDSWDHLEDGGFIKDKYIEHFKIQKDYYGRT